MHYELSSNIRSQKIECSDYELLSDALNKIDNLYKLFDSHQEKLLKELKNSYLKGDSYQWRYRIEQSAIILDRFQKLDLLELRKNIKVSYKTEKDFISLKRDAKALLDYINQGNYLSGIQFNLKKKFLPKDIRDRLDFIENVQVNSSPCDTKEEFEIVIRDIELRQDFIELAELWDTDTIPKSTTYDRKFIYFQNYHLEAIRLIDILDNLKSLITEVESIINQKLQPFDTEQLCILLENAKSSQLEAVIKYSRNLVSESEKYLNKVNKHPIVDKLLSCIREIDPISYELVLSELIIISNGKEKYDDFKRVESSLREKVPNLIDQIFSDAFLESNMSELKEAMKFRDAQIKIKLLLDSEYEKHLFDNLKDDESTEKNLISKVASKLAWKYVIENLQNNNSLRRYLEAWVLAVKRIGKTGKGKRALRFRKEAQIQMEKCKTAVPCWIMPLYKVAETVHPEQGMYDYVIIDEASQLGPDAIFLLYIAKNIIIVGDDKQTSPEYVGVEADTMTPYIQEHLRGIPFANYYGTECSFFDHAKLFCNGLTVLREHFRCMPEIIEFSNKHFYAKDGIGLYPLKQYSEKRLEPLKSVLS